MFSGPAVQITHAGSRPIVADRNSVVFDDDGQVYHRVQLDERGDRCVFLAVRPEPLAAMGDAGGETPTEGFSFPFAQGPVDARTYALHALAARSVPGDRTVDALAVEEMLLRLAGAALALAYRAWGPARAPAQPEGGGV